jgi:hypothetical protein
MPLHDRVNGKDFSMDLIDLVERDRDVWNLHPFLNGSAIQAKLHDLTVKDAVHTFTVEMVSTLF